MWVFFGVFHVNLEGVDNLKPRVRDKRLYRMGTSGIMLIPVTHPTQCVAECAKCGFSGLANMTWLVLQVEILRTWKSSFKYNVF